ncbi:MAG: hypothetical protein ACRDRH_13500 [Pseudonocardia sp.]
MTSRPSFAGDCALAPTAPHRKRWPAQKVMLHTVDHPRDHADVIVDNREEFRRTPPPAS